MEAMGLFPFSVFLLSASTISGKFIADIFLRNLEKGFTLIQGTVCCFGGGPKVGSFSPHPCLLMNHFYRAYQMKPEIC